MARHNGLTAAFASIGRWSVRWRWLVLGVWLAAAVAVTLLLPPLASVTQSDNSRFLPSSAPSSQALQLASPLQPAGLTPVTVLAASPAGALTAADQTAIAQIVAALGRVRHVTSVKDVARSADGRAEDIRVQARLTGAGPQVTAERLLVRNLRSAVSGVSRPAGLRVHLAGQVATRVDNNATSGHLGNQVTNLSLLFVILLLMIVFRSLLAPLVTVGPAFLVVRLAGPLIAEAAKAGLAVSQVAQLLLIVLVLGAGTDYGLFLVFRVREEMARGQEPRQAVIRAVSRVGESVTFSAATVIAALLSLLIASFGLYSGLAVPLAIGIVLMLAAGLTLLPALIAIFGRALFWPGAIRPLTGQPGWWGRVAVRIVARPVLTLAIGLVLFGGLAAASAGYHATGFGGTVTAPAHSDSAAGNSLLQTYFPQATASPTDIVLQLRQPVWGSPAAIATAQHALRASGQFQQLSGPLDPNGHQLTPAQLAALHARLGPAQGLPASQPAATASVPHSVYQAYRASAQYLSADGRTLMFAATLRAGAANSTAAMQAVPAVRAAAASAARPAGASAYGVTGVAATSYDVSNISGRDLLSVIPLAIVVIALLLALVLRSLVAPLYLVVSVVLSYLTALGLTVLLFSGQGLTFILPFLMFVFLLALGEDYNILVMTRIREEARQFPLRSAVARALRATGTTVTSAGLVLAGTFAVFAVAGSGGPNGPEIRNIGAGLAVGVLIDTFGVRTLLVPSAVVLLGRWNWWPSSRRRERRAVTMEMTEQEIIQGLAELIEEYTEVPVSAVTPAASLREDLEIDSLSMVEIVVSALEKYGVEISDAELKEIRTVQDVVDFVQHSKVSA